LRDTSRKLKTVLTKNMKSSREMPSEFEKAVRRFVGAAQRVAASARWAGADVTEVNRAKFADLLDKLARLEMLLKARENDRRERNKLLVTDEDDG